MLRGYVFLFAIMDLYSRKIIDFEISTTLDTSFCLRCLKTGAEDLLCTRDHEYRSRLSIYFRRVDIPMAPHEARRYNERGAAERFNARLKDEFGGRNVMVRGAKKVMLHLMFGVISLFADHLLKLETG